MSSVSENTDSESRSKKEVGSKTDLSGSYICDASCDVGVLFFWVGIWSWIPWNGRTGSGCAVILPGIVTFFFSMLKTNGILFAYKDYEMLMSLPVPTRTVIASRFLLMYLFHLGMTAFVLVPMGIGYFLWAESSVMAVLIWITGIFLIPLIPTTAATLVGAGIIFISARFRRANAVSTVLTVLLTMSVLIASFGSTAVIPEEGFTPEQIGMIGKALRDSIYQMYPPANWFFRGVTGAADGFLSVLLLCQWECI